MTVSRPFSTGDLIVDPAAPQYPAMTVYRCIHASGRWHRYWRVEARNGRIFSSGPADRFVKAPAGWTDPPIQPATALDRLELSTDGLLDPADIAQARHDDAAQTGAYVAWCLEMVTWWETMGARVNPTLARREADGMHELAYRLIAESAPSGSGQNRRKQL